MDKVGDAEAASSSEGAASPVLAAMSSALVRAATWASEGGIERRRLVSL
jgi:hypothetical protein